MTPKSLLQFTNVRSQALLQPASASVSELTECLEKKIGNKKCHVFDDFFCHYVIIHHCDDQPLRALQHVKQLCQPLKFYKDKVVKSKVIITNTYYTAVKKKKKRRS